MADDWRAMLFTAGYEGLIQDELIDLLLAQGVRRVIDVRAVAMSRKPGFSKRVLAASLAARGIAYAHLPALGTPKPGRIAARAGRTAEMAAIFTSHMRSDAALAGLGEARALAAAAPSCLLCFERDFHQCHRRIVADMMCAAGGGAVVHL